MGVGQGYALAAALYSRDHSPATKVLVVQGDSAYGFSAMEIETIARYKLPAVIVVLNNSGIYRGMLPEDMNAIDGDPTLQRVRGYVDLGSERMLVLANWVQDKSACGHRRCAFKEKDQAIINVIIATDSERKAQTHPWLTRSKV
ncbi:hypothetical protein KIN20_022242 [Parelaphostrongylus tenuis]|uniref:2-hydroxyacyl-CoA lyase n=1 Tax=Parelaphostrongylus tenuis TaxID=148309 RepID=A0AAD5QS41_PARTN|nr:hypothetical protein KIN20_022242 [Parelaphostrongylus tenuis]